MINMGNSENTYFYKRNLVIEKERETITPELGDEFIVCKDLPEVYELVSKNKFGQDNSYKVIEYYSSESFDEHVTDYKLCNRLEPYNFFGYKLEYPDGTTKREFFLYETTIKENPGF